MRKKWKSIAFSTAPVQIIDGDRGKNYPKQNDYSDSGFCVFLNTGNVTESGFSFNRVQFISEEKDDALRKGKLKRNDVVMTTRGTIGNIAHYHEKIPFDHMRINSGMVIFRCDQGQLSPLFLYHFLRSPNFYGQANALQSGVAQPQLPIRDVNRITLSLPPIDEQSRIANFISNYDDLIENNRRRIQLLEQSARLLYKEWFVHLRFPGHERVKIKDGVPEGWNNFSLAELSDSINYGYTASGERNSVGPKFLRITDIVPDVIDWATVPFCRISEKDFQKFSLREGDVVVARTGATVGYAKRIGQLEHNAVFASYLVRFHFSEKIDNTIAGIFMESQNYKAFVRNNAGGAAQPNANATVLSAAKLLVPPNSVQKNFRELVEPINHQKDILQKQNHSLFKVRDLLIPRLMNGEIEV